MHETRMQETRVPVAARPVGSEGVAGVGSCRTRALQRRRDGIPVYYSVGGALTNVMVLERARGNAAGAVAAGRIGGLGASEDLSRYGSNSSRRTWNTMAGKHPHPVSVDLRERQGRWEVASNHESTKIAREPKQANQTRTRCRMLQVAEAVAIATAAG